MKETVGVVVAAVIALYVNWTTVGSDNELSELNKVRNSRGFLIRIGEEE